MGIKLKEIILITAKMRLITGVSIIGYAASRKIGGVDNPIVKDPLTEYPYIPGSSLRGKMRSLLELKLGKCTENGEPHKLQLECWNESQNYKCKICRLFGSIPAQNLSNNEKAELELAKKKLGPTRLLVRDAYLDEESKINLRKYMEKTGLPYTEIKIENFLNRYFAKATPRQNERIPAGTVFDVEFVLKIFEGDEKIELINTLTECLNLVEMDSIGGSGSRGYGKVKFENLEVIAGNKKMKLEEYLESLAKN
ncbi:MAG: type III-A CRISPR-associated RAMP protein Csm3 [Leptospiraceae bacterium]|nr:type III-A CRISPR-associated RAMP protein Csm3 [Leptospiraceae bacterium]